MKQETRAAGGRGRGVRCPRISICTPGNRCVLEAPLGLTARRTPLLLCHFIGELLADLEDLSRELLIVQAPEIQEGVHLGKLSPHVGKTAEYLGLVFRVGDRLRCIINVRGPPRA